MNPQPEFLHHRPDASYWTSEHKKEFEEGALPVYLAGCRWFGGKARKLKSTKVVECIPLDREDIADGALNCLVVQAVYEDGGGERFLMPVRLLEGRLAREEGEFRPQDVIVQCGGERGTGVLVDALCDPAFRMLLLELAATGGGRTGARGRLAGNPSRVLEEMRRRGCLPSNSRSPGVEQSNSSIFYEDKLFLKLFRRVREGMNPDLEMIRYLSEEAHFSHVPQYAGHLEYVCEGEPPTVVALLQGLVACEADAWAFTLNVLERYVEWLLENRRAVGVVAPGGTPGQGAPKMVLDYLENTYLPKARLLGRRTAELHLALSRKTGNSRFGVEIFSRFDQRCADARIKRALKETSEVLEKRLPGLAPETRGEAENFLRDAPLFDRAREMLVRRNVHVGKIRIHGDYHLGQVLHGGADFFIIDFEGEPVRGLDERCAKNLAMVDLAGMLRSFDYAAQSALLHRHVDEKGCREFLLPCVDLWYRWVKRAFLDSYLSVTCGAPFIPADTADFHDLLCLFQLEKAVYETLYELNNRPGWLSIPLRGISQLLQRFREDGDEDGK
ncbi:MAG: putative maltokinase [Verrucomicrobiae bacterium]|nr:putative maltokinase [Verrucomicrobiae bacterium]